MVRIQTQEWRSSGLTRAIFITEHGTAQLELYSKPCGDRKVTAYFYALWVEPPYRRNGEATELIDMAERYARARGHKKIHLKFDNRDTPYEIFDWYVRRGYDDVEFGNHESLLEKVLTTE